MGMRRGGDEEDEDEEERLREEREERKERNRAWRLERERRMRHERGEFSAEEEDEQKESRRRRRRGGRGRQQLEQARARLTCSACQSDLVGKIWQCQVGHPACKDCVELFWLEEEDVIPTKRSVSLDLSAGSNEGGGGGSRRRRKRSDSSLATLSSSSSLQRFSTISDDSVKAMIERMSENELLELVDQCSDTASNVTFSGPPLTQRQIVEIDWFLNTLDIRGDAIRPYADYNDPVELTQSTETISAADQVGSLLDGDDGDTLAEEEEEEANKAWKVVPKDEVAMKQVQDAKKAAAAAASEQNKRRGADDDSGNDTLSESTQPDFSAGPPRLVKPIDFEEGTIEIKKDVIAPYTDYNAADEATVRAVRIDDNVRVLESEDEELESASVLGRTRSSTCSSCQAPIVGRNLYLEQLSRVILQK